jgi:peptidyl-prolyl cis-trans isomerase B (cyclophilin B)
VLAALGAAALTLAACGSSSSGGSSISVGNEKGASSTSSTPAGTSSAAAPATGCKTVSAPQPKGPQHLAKPTAKLDPAKHYVVKLLTNCGEIDIALDVKQSPKTSASFAYLVGKGFFDELTFHRIVPGFVIQGGDPSGNGAGGPGYQVVERPPAKVSYAPGTVAMAKTQNDPAGASGSQFFIVTGTQSPLTPIYALLGMVVKGMDVVNRISSIPADQTTGAPSSPVVISRATLSPG